MSAPRTRRNPRLVSSEPYKLPATREEIDRYLDRVRVERSDGRR